MPNQLPQRIIVFCLPGIGDAVLFTPALGLLRQLFPRARITVMTMIRGTAEILASNPSLDEVRHFDFFNASKIASLRCLWQLRREHYDLSIMTFPSNRLEYNCVNWFVGRRWSAAHCYNHQSRRNLWFLNNIVVHEADRCHNAEENLRLIRAIAERIGVPMPAAPSERDALMRQFPLELPLPDEARAYASDFLAKRAISSDAPLFGFHTWSSTFKNMTRKCWDKDNFVALIRRLAEAHTAARFLIFSGPADEAVSQYILKHAGDRVVLVQESNLRRAVALQQRCRVFITNDSGPMHLAAAVGVPIVALFGPTDKRRLHPWTNRHVIVSQNLPCMPCFYYSSQPLRCVANIDYACMREIPVDEVFGAVQALLAETQPGRAIANGA